MSHFGNSQSAEIIFYVDKFRQSFAMVFPKVTKPLPNDERLFYSPDQAWEEEGGGGASSRWFDELVGRFFNPWICVPLASSPSSSLFPPSFLSWMFHLEADGWNLYVAIDVEAIVFGGQHHRAVVHQGNVEALGVFHLVVFNININMVVVNILLVITSHTDNLCLNF